MFTPLGIAHARPTGHGPSHDHALVAEGLYR